MGASRTICIIGAGIAGLTLALGLAKFGLNVVILERNAGISEFGAGLQISPNARKVLDRLGLDEALAQKSFTPKGIDIYPDGRERPLQTLSLGEEIAHQFGAPYSVMHRADLVEILQAATRPFANIDIVFGATDIEIETTDTLSVSAREPDGKMRRVRPFALVGADGVRSAIRTGMLGGPEARYTGKVAWRALVAPEALEGQVRLDHTSLLLGSDFHLVVYPLPHRNAVNLALFTREAESDLSVLHSRSPRLKPGSNARLQAILKAVGEDWTPWILSSAELDSWHRGPIGLIGDAAHAMLPFQAQGAAMAIEDAAVLAPLLAASPNPEHAFTRYHALRHERVRRVQEVSRKNGKIFHMRWPLSMARNTVIALEGPRGHFKRLAWLYGHDAGGG